MSKKALLGAFAVVLVWLLVLSFRTGGVVQTIVEKVVPAATLGGRTDFNIVCTAEGGDPVCEGWAAGTISATSSAAWRNLTGNTVFVDKVEVWPINEASSTAQLVVASSTRSNYDDYTVPVLTRDVTAFLIASTTIATSSRNVVTNLSNGTNLTGGVNSYANATTSVFVYNRDYVVFLRRAAVKSCAGADGSSNGNFSVHRSCASATSSQQTNWQWRLKFHYQP